MRTLAALVFPGFETLDYFGPMEMLGGFGNETEIITVAKASDPVPSCHGQRIVIDKTIMEKNDYDLLYHPRRRRCIDRGGRCRITPMDTGSFSKCGKGNDPAP